MTRLTEHLLLALILCLAVTGIASCSAPRAGTKHRPAPLEETARLFRLKPASGRYNEAQEVLRLLPSCPLLWKQDIGSGTLVALDHSRPSYVLLENDVVALLGEPSSTSDGILTYLIKESGTCRSYLWVKFDHGRATEASCYVVPE